MDSIWLWPLGLVAFLLALPGLRTLAATLLGSRLRPQALRSQPDHIFLLRVTEPKWRNLQPREATDRQLGAVGFIEAGAYVVREMPELTIALYAHPADSAYAVVYDHPLSGLWAEFVTRYDDGTLVTYTTLEPMDVDLPEGSVHVAAPQSSGKPCLPSARGSPCWSARVRPQHRISSAAMPSRSPITDSMRLRTMRTMTARR